MQISGAEAMRGFVRVERAGTAQRQFAIILRFIMALAHGHQRRRSLSELAGRPFSSYFAEHLFHMVKLFV